MKHPLYVIIDHNWNKIISLWCDLEGIFGYNQKQTINLLPLHILSVVFLKIC